jgi:hypothetical protein
LQCLYPLVPCSFPDCHMLLPSPEFLLAARSLTRDSTCDSTRDSPSRQLPWVACDLHVPSRLQLHACWNSGRCLGPSHSIVKFIYLYITFNNILYFKFNNMFVLVFFNFKYLFATKDFYL